MPPVLFHAALESKMRKWKLKLQHHGVDIGAYERLTNIRCADDLLIYALSCNDLVHMVDELTTELEDIGLQFKADKTKIYPTLDLRGRRCFNRSFARHSNT